jgi:hypothetical protein
VRTPRKATAALIAIAAIGLGGTATTTAAAATSPDIQSRLTVSAVQSVDAAHPLPTIGERITATAKASRTAPTLATATEHGDVIAQRAGKTYKATSASVAPHAANAVAPAIAIADCAAMFPGDGTRTVDHYQFCDVHDVGYAVLLDGVVVGNAGWRQVTAGNTYANDRASYFETKYTDLFTVGEVTDGLLEDYLATSGYSGADGSNPACHVTDNPTNPTLLSEWEEGLTAFHEVWSDRSEGYGPDYISRCVIGTWPVNAGGVGSQVVSTSTRADSASYFGTTSLNGDIFDGAVPVFSLYSLSSSSNGAVAQHINDALTNPAGTWPVFADKSIPGSVAGGRPLHRLVDGWDAASTARKAANLSNKNAACASWQAANPTVSTAGEDCDEFPFASVWEGAGLDNKNFSVRYVDSTQNQSAGGTLAGWYNSERILQRDPFYVEIQP